jgi:hypothetical protein
VKAKKEVGIVHYINNARYLAFEMWLYRRILLKSLVDSVTNEAVLERMGKKK